MTFLNRTQRRELAQRLRSQGNDILVLRGGPMDGWTVKPDAPALRPDWGLGYVVLVAESGYRNDHPGDKTPWERLPVAVRERYLEVAARQFGVGHYEAKASEASARWVQNA